MEKNDGLTQHRQPKLCPRVKIGDPGGAPSVRNGPQWHGESRMDFSLKKVRKPRNDFETDRNGRTFSSLKTAAIFAPGV